MTEQVNLGGAWRMREADSETWHSAHVPGSVYADLTADGTMPDPFWRENELDAFGAHEERLCVPARVHRD